MAKSKKQSKKLGQKELVVVAVIVAVLGVLGFLVWRQRSNEAQATGYTKVFKVDGAGEILACRTSYSLVSPIRFYFQGRNARKARAHMSDHYHTLVPGDGVGSRNSSPYIRRTREIRNMYIPNGLQGARALYYSFEMINKQGRIYNTHYAMKAELVSRCP